MPYSSNQTIGGLETLDNSTIATGDLAVVGDVSDTNRAKAITVANLDTYLSQTTKTLTNKTLTSPILVTPALGTPASGVMTNVTGLPASAVLAGTFGAGNYVLSGSLQPTTIELGHATDTTLARSGAGDITIEGKGVYRADGTDVPVGDGGTGKSTWTQYLIPYSDTTTSFSQIAIGSSGQVLMSNGAGVAPSFQSSSSYSQQVLAGGVDSNANIGLIAAGALNAGIGSNDLYVSIGGNGVSLKGIHKYSKDSTTGMYYHTGTYVDIGTLYGGSLVVLSCITVLGSYVYASLDYSTSTTAKVGRFDIGTLANGVDLTISGTAPTYSPQQHPIFNDGTYLYICDGTTQTDIKKYSISGTTITYVSTISFTNFVKTHSAWCDGTDVYQYDGTTISKWSLSGGARTSTTTRLFHGNPAGSSIYWPAGNGAGNSVVGIDSSKVMLFTSDLLYNTAATAVVGSRVLTLPVAKP